MLKLEKIGRLDISVSLRDRHSRFDRIFLQAFAIAIALHLGAVILFHIQPFISIGDSILPPSLVEADIDFGSNDIVAQIENEGLPRHYLLEPKISMLDLPKMPSAVLQRKMEYIKENSMLTNPFLESEEDWQYLANYDRTTLPSKPIQVHVSGELAKIPLLKDGSDYPISTSNPFKPDFVSFIVQVESKTGSIFWYMPKQTANTPFVNALAEKILNEVRFQPKSQAFVYTGEIEIQLVMSAQ